VISDSRITSSACCGNAIRLASGNWIADWGANDLVTELSPMGTPLITIDLSPYFSYRAEPVRSLISDLRLGMDAMVPPLKI